MSSTASQILALLGADLEAEAIPPLATFFNSVAANQKLTGGPPVVGIADLAALNTLEAQLAAALPTELETIAAQGNAAIQTRLATLLANAQATVAKA